MTRHLPSSHRLLVIITLLSFSTVLSSILFYGCKKTDKLSEKESAEKASFGVAESKEWWYGTFAKGATFQISARGSNFNTAADLSGAMRSSKKPEQNKIPVWTAGKAYGIGKGMKAVELPLFTSITSVMIPNSGNKLTSREKDRIAEASLNKVLIVKSGGSHYVRNISLVPTIEYAKANGYDISKNSLEKLAPDFTGWMVVRDWQDNLLHIWDYKNGTLAKELKIVKKAAKSSRAGATNREVCDYVTVERRYRICVHAPIPGDVPPNPNEQECLEWAEQVEYDVEMQCTEVPDDGPDCSGGESMPGCDPCTRYGICDDGDGEIEPGKFTDCAGVIEGSAFIGNCGICIGGTTGLSSCDDPCAQILALENKSNEPRISEQNDTTLARTLRSTPPVEFGTEHKKQSLSSDDYINTPVRTDGATSQFNPNFTWNSTDGFTIGASHGHPGGSAPSPADAVWAFHNYNSIPSSDQQYYRENVSVYTLTSTSTFIVTPKDWNLLQARHAEFMSSPDAMRSAYQNAAQDYFTANPGASPQDAGAYALMTLFGNAINLYKAPIGSNDFQALELNSASQVSNKPCN